MIEHKLREWCGPQVVFELLNGETKVGRLVNWTADASESPQWFLIQEHYTGEEVLLNASVVWSVRLHLQT